MNPADLDDATRERLRFEAQRLATEQEMDLKAARRIVWLDYLDEQATAAPVTTEPPQAEPRPPHTPVPEPPPPGRPRFWRGADEPTLTPEWLQRNRDQLARVKRLIGLRN